MPHFIIECSENILTKKTPEEIMQAVYEVAEATALFAKGDIKVRINPYKYYKLGEGKKDFMHVFGNIMEGRRQGAKSGSFKEGDRTIKSTVSGDCYFIHECNGIRNGHL